MIIKIIFIYLIIFILNFIFKKLGYLNSNTGSSHQTFANVSIPLSGGIFICFPMIYLFSQIYFEITLVYFLIFILGILSDLNIIQSPKKRFLFQLIIIIIFTFYLQLEVLPSRILFLDNFLMGTFISFIFTSFCLMVLINGSNFIDGLNGLFLGYFLIILAILYKLNLFNLISIDKGEVILVMQILFFILVLNFFNQLFCGDNGAYSLSFIVGCILIKIYNTNTYISPYFIILLLWYPCFENLFSIIRKKISKNNPLEPDNKHFHQYLFIYLKQTFEINNANSNILSSLIINFYNFLIFYWASKNPNLTMFQIGLLLFNVFIYIFIYTFLKKSILKKKFYHR